MSQGHYLSTEGKRRVLQPVPGSMLGSSATGDEDQIEGAGGGERRDEVTPRGIPE